ncbi:MAG TPA: serine hydrolase domain-containing protein [Caulobacteraceae bacterium]|nr:serine hydrolase domain-containing protein [Caulobacteraceae bacterium]
MDSKALRDWIAGEMAWFDVQGAAVAIVEPSGETALSFGVRRFGEDGGVNPDTGFSLASCSKAFTAYGVAILVDQGKIAFDDPVQKYIPEFALDTEEPSAAATVRDLLAMRLGLKPQGACHWATSRSLSPVAIFRRFQYLPRIAPFREAFVYLNPAYLALSVIIERVSGAPFAEFMNRELFAPLGMANTFIDEGAVTDRKNVAIPHVKLASGVTALASPHCAGRQGESCQYISASDYIPWLNLNLDGLLPNGGRLVSEAVQAEFLTIQTPVPHPAGDAGYCMGWMRGTIEGRKLFSHEGGELGASTFAIICPDEDIGVAVLASRRVPTFVRSLAYGLRDRLLGGPTPDRRSEFLEVERMEREGALAQREADFPLEPGKAAPSADSITGVYRSPHTGLLRLTGEAGLVRARFEDVNLSDCRLEPLGGEIFGVVEFDEPAMNQEVQGQARMRIVPQGAIAGRVDTPGMGSFERLE